MTIHESTKFFKMLNRILEWKCH